jgi:hypothetical protein
VTHSHVYVIAFDSGTLKVGRAADARGRLATHRREAARHGVKTTAEWCSPPCSARQAEHYERQVIAYCTSRGTLRAGSEYFSGLDFPEVRQYVEALTGGKQAPQPAEVRAAYPVPAPRSQTASTAVRSPHRADEEDELMPADLCPLVPAWPLPEPRPSLARLAGVDEKYEL